jgi:hypothetical protein
MTPSRKGGILEIQYYVGCVMVCKRLDWLGPFPTKLAFIRFGNEKPRIGNCLYYNEEVLLCGMFGLASCPDRYGWREREKFCWVFMDDGSITTLKYSFGKSNTVLTGAPNGITAI